MADIHADAVKPDIAARLRAAMGDADRRRSEIMERVRHVYLRTSRDDVLQANFERLVHDLLDLREPDARPAEDPSARAERLEGNILVVLGESGAGKTTAIRRLLGRHPLSPGYGRLQEGPVALTVRVPSPCSVAELGRKVLRATGYKPVSNRVTGPEVWGIVRERLEALGILILHLDEFQDAHLTLNVDEQTKLRHLLRTLLVDEQYPIGLIVSGQPEFETFLRPDRSSVRRGRWQLFPRLALPADGPAVMAAVEKLAAVSGLEVQPDFRALVLPRLVHAGCNLLGITIEEIHDAIRVALERGETVLRLDIFAHAFALRTGNLEPWNVYLAEDYLAVDPTRVLAHAPAEVPVISKGRRRKPNGDRA